MSRRPIYDAEGNMIDVQGDILAPQHAVRQFMSAMQYGQRQAAEAAAAQFRASDVAYSANTPSHSRQHRAEPNGRWPGPPRLSPASRALPPSITAHPTSHTSRPPSSTRPHWSESNNLASACPAPPNNSQADASPQAAGRRLSPAILDTNNTYGSEAVPSYESTETATSGRTAASNWLPQESPASLGNFFPPADNSNGTWASTADVSAPGVEYSPPLHSSPQSARNPPSIRVTTAAWHGSGDQDFSQPQDATYSASSASPLPHDLLPYNSNYYAGQLAPQAYQMPSESENMQTPVSPVSATENSTQDQALGEPQIQQFPTRKRSHSVMSQADPALMNDVQQHRSESVGSGVNGANEASEEYSRGSRAFKRGEPPTNSENKFICTFSEECQGQIFDRKCEWSKHMDKHDRPYRCPHPSCAKLQGFTYSGGLLRHEREVHGKHGGPKAQLMCPHPECKRHTGKGFTRKENLNEHLRRVHAGKEEETQHSLIAQSATELALSGPDGETPASHAPEMVDHELAAPLTKRKRSLPPGAEDDMVEDVDPAQQEIKQLRELLAQKDRTISDLHSDIMQLEQDRQTLQNTLLQVQHQQPTGQV